MKLVLAEKPSVAQSLAKVLLAKIHSKYFSGIWMKTCFDFQFDCGWIFALKTAKIGGR